MEMEIEIEMEMEMEIDIDIDRDVVIDIDTDIDIDIEIERERDREDLIICVAILVVQKLCPPLTLDKPGVISIASRNRLRSKSLFGANLVVLGSQNRCPNSILEPFFPM